MKIKWSGKRTLVALVLLGGVGLLYVQGADQRREQGRDGAPASSETSACRMVSTADGVRVRSAPAIDPANVVDELAAGEEADASIEVRNNFRKLDEGRWASEDFLRPLDGTTC
ncbi:SH3 domain-containing protein [Actinophytocola glycyrrhizae]|uniref:SH3 domain-containing protein n=1 Tax=Actinophytocola glycyrrhizae TaxID=2044873 RepID=A0ABV9RYU8_9PSEU